jgi:hypothetical protein
MSAVGGQHGLADTDGDGPNDGAETTTHLSNPLLADSDGDGLSDGAEVNTQHTNPTRARGRTRTATG